MNNDQSVSRYVETVEKEMNTHRLHERLAVLTANTTEYPAQEETVKGLEKLDVQFVEMQINAEKTCRKLKTGDLEFSEPVQYWVNKRRSYKELIKRQSGKTKNNSNIIKRAKAHGIKTPKRLSTLQLWDGVTYCKARMKVLKNSHSKGL